VALKQVNRTYLTARHGATRNAMGLSHNAVIRARELADLAPSALLEIMRERKAVLLPFVDTSADAEPGKDHDFTYHLFYRAEIDTFFIAVVEAFRRSHIGRVSEIVDVFPLKALEQTETKVSRRFLRTAASRVLDQVQFREWEERARMLVPGRPRLRVITYYDTGAERPDHVVFTSPPLCQPYIDQYGLEFAFGHPGFTEWYRCLLDEAAIDPERVVSLRIADTDKLVLRVDAPARECPNCECLRSGSSIGSARSPNGPSTRAPHAEPGWTLVGRIKREWARLLRLPQG
jgi:hypothetical protein